MDKQDLPLLDFFLQVQNKLGLRTEQYEVLLCALQKGLGCDDNKQLMRLCKMLWLHTNDVRKNKAFDIEFKAYIETLTLDETAPSANPLNDTASDLSNNESSDSPIKDVPKEKIKEPNNTPNVQPSYSSTPKTRELVEMKAFRVPKTRYQPTQALSLWSDEYYDITRHQLQFHWRKLQSRIATNSFDIDLTATIREIARNGMFVEAKYKKRYEYQAQITLFIDYGGSMTPFNELSRRLIQTAQQTYNQSAIKVYYFRNYPQQYLYTDPYQTQALPIKEVIPTLKGKIMIMSDAGAARMSYNTERIWGSIEFFGELKQQTPHIVWLNPIAPNDPTMPSTGKNIWQRSSADDIARLCKIPMLYINQNNFFTAIKYLKSGN